MKKRHMFLAISLFTVLLTGSLTGAYFWMPTYGTSSQNIQPATTLEDSEQLPNDGVIKIPVGDEGYYIWDSRASLCFFVHMRGIVSVPCKPVTRITGIK